MNRPARPSRGFTLIEVIASIFVIGIIIIASTSLLRAAQATQATRDQDLALKIASNELEAVRAGGYAALPASGPFTDTELSSLAGSAATLTVASYNEDTKQVDATVTWLAQDQTARTLTLTTLITKIGGLP